MLAYFLKPFCKNICGVIWGTDLYTFAMKNKFFWKFFAIYFDCLVATSKNMCDFAHSNFGLNVVHRPFGLSKNFSKIKLRKKKIQQKLKINLIVVKELRHKAGVDLAIAFLQRNSPIFSDVEFVLDIYGSGPEEKNLRTLAQMGNHENLKITFKGNVSENFLIKKLPNYDFFLGFSRSESLGISFIEAAYLGVVPVISRTPGPLEIFGDDYPYLYYVNKKLMYKLLKLFEDEKAFNELRKLNHDKLYNYKWENWSEWYLKI